MGATTEPIELLRSDAVLRRAVERKFLGRIQPNIKTRCWYWLGVPSKAGYGTMSVASKVMYAHRISHELFTGPIPDGLTIDHLCRVRHCVNPAHLEAVTQRVNNLRGTGMSARHAKVTHCPFGHAYDAANTIVAEPGIRKCRACKARRDRIRHERDMAAIGRGVGIRRSDRTHCPRGHAYDEANTYITPSTGARMCRACRKVARARHYEQERRAIAESRAA